MPIAIPPRRPFQPPQAAWASTWQRNVMPPRSTSQSRRIGGRASRPPWIHSRADQGRFIGTPPSRSRPRDRPRRDRPSLRPLAGIPAAPCSPIKLALGHRFPSSRTPASGPAVRQVYLPPLPATAQLGTFTGSLPALFIALLTPRKMSSAASSCLSFLGSGGTKACEPPFSSSPFFR
jgi:hypothetical protein